MATIPTLQENQRLRPSNPTGFQSSSAARIRGQALSQFGRGATSLGVAVSKLEKRQARSEKSLAQADFKQAMSRNLQDLNERMNKRGGTGADDKEFFDTQAPNVLNKTLKEFDKKYGGKYGNEFNVTGNSLITGVRSGVIANGLEKQKNFLAEGVSKLESRLNAQAYQNPEAIDELTTDFTSQVGGVMIASEATPQAVENATFTGHRALVDSSIDGYIEKGNYKAATDLVLNKYPHLYSSKDQRKALSDIRNAKLNSISLKQKEDDRRQKKIEEAVKETQVENAARARAALAKTEDPRVAKKLKDQIIRMGEVGDVAYKDFGGLLNETTTKGKQISAIGSYDISEKVYNAETTADLDKVRFTLNKLEQTGSIDPKTAERWERTIHQLKKTRVGKPLATAESKIFFEKLQEFTKPMGVIEKMFDQLNGQVALKKKVQTEAQYKFAVLNGTNPELAYLKAVQDNYPGFESIELFPGYNKVPKSSQEIQEFVQWGRSNLEDSKVPMFKSYLEQLEAALSRENIIDKLKTLSVEEDTERNVQVIEDFLDLDELTKQRGNELPLIFRR